MKFFNIFIFIFIIFLKYFTIFGMFTPQSQRQLRKSSSAIVSAISKSPRQLRLMATGLNKSCVSGGAFVAKEADEVWNRKAYVISYKQLVSNLGEFESNTYTSKLDDFHRLLVSLERDLTRHLLPIVTLLKDMVNDYNNDEQGLSITENKIRGLRTNIEKILLNVLDGGEIMMTEEEDENVEENLSDFIHERTVYREMVQTLSPKYDKSYKLWLNEKRNLLEETKLCYLNNDILHQINQIDRLHKIYEENILQAKKLIGVTINSNQEETSIDEPSFWQRVSSQIGKISREIYYNLAKNIPIRKLKKGLRNCAYADYKWRDIIQLKNSIELISQDANHISQLADNIIENYSKMINLLKLFKLRKDNSSRLKYINEASSSEISVVDKDEEVDYLKSLLEQVKSKPLIIYLIHFYEKKFKPKKTKTIIIENYKLEQCREIVLKNLQKMFDGISEDKWTATTITLILPLFNISQDYSGRFINRLLGKCEFKFNDREYYRF